MYDTFLCRVVRRWTTISLLKALSVCDSKPVWFGPYFLKYINVLYLLIEMLYYSPLDSIWILTI